MDTDQLIQDTLSDNKEIFERIRTELAKAKSEILVAMAWFTDNEIFTTIQACLDRNVRVSIIISDQSENEKLDFRSLENQGAEVIKIRNVGWGMMNQKFCVIDQTIAITGSYNWTYNSKNNNHVNVIVTNFQKTILELTNTFYSIRNRAIRLNNGELLDDIIATEKNDIKVIHNQGNQTFQRQTISSREVNFQQQSLKEFKDVLDNIIASEVGSFDKDLVKTSGYNRAKENNGDHQVLHQAMDSLYSNFINEIEVIAEKKERLKVKIDEQQKISAANMEFKTETEIEKIKSNSSVLQNNLDADLALINSSIDEKRLKIESNNNTRVPFIKGKIEFLKQQMKDLEIEFVKPAINWPVSLILVFMTLILAFYIVVFYSSVAYIFVFSKSDIQSLINSGAVSIEAPEIFNPNAISEIGNKGLGGILFLSLFVGIPLALGMYKVFRKMSLTEDKLTFENEGYWSKIGNAISDYFGIILIIVVDIFIAYKVSKNIHDIENSINIVEKKFIMSDVLQESNFWLVFVLGALGIYLFGFFFGKLFDSISRRNLSFQQQKTKHLMTGLQREIDDHQEQINKIHLENDALHSEIAKEKVKKDEKNRLIQRLPIELNEKNSELQHQLLNFKERVGNIAQIFKSQVENDKLPISKAEMENRVNIYMEGWSKYLYDVYAILKAEDKTRDAVLECETWLSKLEVQSDSNYEFIKEGLAYNN